MLYPAKVKNNNRWLEQSPPKIYCSILGATHQITNDKLIMASPENESP